MKDLHIPIGLTEDGRPLRPSQTRADMEIDRLRAENAALRDALEQRHTSRMRGGDTPMGRLRALKGLTFRALASMTGISTSTCHRAEHKPGGVGLKEAFAIARALETTVDALWSEVLP